MLGSSYHPQSQAIAERVNRTMKSAIQKFLTNGGKGWQRFLKAWVDEYNDIKHGATGFSPNEIVRGTERVTTQARKNIKKQSERLREERMEVFETNKKSLTFNVGDKVRLRRAKRGVLEKGYLPQYTEKIYTIVKIIDTADDVQMYRLSERGATNFSPDKLLKVDEDKLIKIPEPAPRQGQPARAPGERPPARQRPERERRLPGRLADFAL